MLHLLVYLPGFSVLLAKEVCSTLLLSFYTYYGCAMLSVAEFLYKIWLCYAICCDTLCLQPSRSHLHGVHYFVLDR